MSDIDPGYLAAVSAELHTLETQATKAVAQASDADLFRQLDAEANSIAVLMRHIAGNARSRFTDFLVSDGEKPTRDRDGEFEAPPVATRDALLTEWRDAWRLVFETVASLGPDDLARTVRINGEGRSVVSALQATVRHYAMHVGQIVLLAKHWRGASWQTLSIPKHRREPGARESRGMLADQEPDPVVEADEESFPASDAPAWTPLHPGRPPERTS